MQLSIGVNGSTGEGSACLDNLRRQGGTSNRGGIVGLRTSCSVYVRRRDRCSLLSNYQLSASSSLNAAQLSSGNSTSQGQGLAGRNGYVASDSRSSNGNVAGNQSSLDVSRSCTVQGNFAVQLVLNINNQQCNVGISSIAVQLVDYVVEVSIAELVSLNDRAGGLAFVCVGVNVQNYGISGDIVLVNAIKGYLGLFVIYALNCAFNSTEGSGNVFNLAVRIDGGVADYSTLLRLETLDFFSVTVTSSAPVHTL